MRVFVAWSNPVSGEIAKAIVDWLPKVLQFVEPFVSIDIAKGDRWSPTIKKALDESKVGLLCVTHENRDDRWLNFEAGALSSRLEGARVIPLLFGGLAPTDVDGPLSQMQGAVFARDEMLKVVATINGASDRALDEGRLKESFEMRWAKLEADVTSALKAKPTPLVPRSQLEILNEILVHVRSIRNDNAPALSLWGDDPKETVAANLVRNLVLRDSDGVASSFVKGFRAGLGTSSREVPSGGGGTWINESQRIDDPKDPKKKPR